MHPKIWDIINIYFGVVFIPDGKNDGYVEHLYREKTDKRILKRNPWRDYRLHITVLILVVI